MTLIYATSSDLATWTGTTAPANATQLLRSASLLVRDATAAAYYTVDTAGLPTDAVLLQAFKDATCAQAAAWAALGIDPSIGGVLTNSVKTSKGIGSASIGYGDSTAATVARANALAGLVPEARRILNAAGLVLTAPWIS